MRELGVGFVAYSPLGRGFLTGRIRSVDELAGDDYRRVRFPRFQRENFERNLELVEQVEAVAKRRGATPRQLALAWVLSRGDDVVPIPGTKRASTWRRTSARSTLELSGGSRASSMPWPTRWPAAATRPRACRPVRR